MSIKNFGDIYTSGDGPSITALRGNYFLEDCIKSTTHTSDQGRSVGRDALPPPTTKRRTTNLKTKSNQNCQKIKLYGNLTTNKLKKKHSPRLVERAETDS